MITTLTSKDFILQNIDTKSPYVDNQNKKIVLLIKANWCGHCNRFLPQYEQYSKTLTNYKFCILEETTDGKFINCWKELLQPAFTVQGFPTLVVYNNDGTPIKVINDRQNLEKELADI